MKQHITATWVVSVTLMVAWFWPLSTVSGQERDIEPPDVFALVAHVRQELDLITASLQKPHDSRPEIRVRHAQPREVYFQAYTLFLKAHRLCTEFTRRGFPSPLASQEILAIPLGHALRPQDVWGMVNRALSQIKCVKADLQLTQQADTPARDASKTPTDVFTSIVQANRQLNLLLDRKFSPRDVFAQVQLASDYTTTLLDALAPVWRTTAPALPSYEPGKRPVDVYKRLMTCYELIQQIAQASELTVLELESHIDPSVVPSDVYDMATLVVAEVQYFAAHIGAQVSPVVRRPHRKLPSHVFQLVGLLEGQLRALQSVAHIYPTWHALKP